MGSELTAAVLGFAAIGYWVDRSFESFPRGTATGAVLGIIGGMYNFLREALALSKAQQLAQEQTTKDRQTPQPTDQTHRPNDDQPDPDA